MNLEADTAAVVNQDPTAELLAGGQRRFGDYELVEEIARGGMGVVYKARQSSLNRVVALKMVLRGPFASEADMARFRAEAETAAQLQHPNIVAIHEVGEHEGQPFFSMDLVQGQNLAQLVRNEPLLARKAATYLKIIAEGVKYAHSRGVLHRDLKPSNILIDENDQPRITDFGLAKRLSDSQLSTNDPQLTQTGQVLGSPSFIPPEQAAGLKDVIGPASDVYSLGAILYHCLTARPPFGAETLTQTLRMVAEQEPVSPRLLNASVPRDLETICLKCLSKEPNRRYATAQALAEDLSRFLRNELILARPAGQAEKLWRWFQRHPSLASFSALTVLLLLTAAVGSSLYASRLSAANRRGIEALREAYIGQARAERWSGRMERRSRSLELLKKAAQIKPTVEVRNEMIACLALRDLRSVKRVRSLGGQEVAFDQDFQRIIDPENGTNIVVRRARDGYELARFTGAEKVAWCGLSPGDQLVFGAWHGQSGYRFQFYDLESQRPVFSFTNRYIRSWDFSSDGNRLFLSVGEPSSILECSLRSGWVHELCEFPIVVEGKIDPTSQRLAVFGEKTNVVQIRSSADGRLLFSLPHPGSVRGLSWHRAGRVLATGCSDGNIYLWDTESRQQLRVLSGHDSLVTFVGFSHDGKLLASASWDNTCRLWNPWSGRQILSRPGSFGGFSRDDRWIYVAVQDYDEICEVEGGSVWREFYPESPLRTEGVDCQWSPDGTILRTRHKDRLRFWNVSKGQELNVPIPNSGQVYDIAFAPSGSELVVATSGGLCTCPIRWEGTRSGMEISIGEPQVIRSNLIADRLALDDSGKTLAAMVRGKLLILEWPGGRDLRAFQLEEDIFGFTLSPGGRFCVAWPWAAAWAARGPRRVWDIATGKVVKELPSKNTYGAAFTPDDRFLLTGSDDEYLMWDTAGWSNVWKLAREDSGRAHGKVAFTSDGRLGALAFSAKEVRLFDPPTGREYATLEAPEPQTLTWLGFSRDGGQLAAMTLKSVVHMWDLRLVRQELAKLGLDWDALPPGTTSPLTNLPGKWVTVLQPTNRSSQ